MSIVLIWEGHAWAGWNPECVICPRVFDSLSDRAIAIDNLNMPHFVYGYEQLYHAYHDGIQWNYETVDISPEAVQDASIAIDSNNRVHIIYYGGSNLKYATNSTGNWMTTTVYANRGSYPSMSLDSYNKVHISYYAYTANNNVELRYATNMSNSWSFYTVDVSDGGANSSLTIDANNNVHISYYSSSTYPSAFKLKYATNASGSWTSETVESSTNAFPGIFNSIAIDSNNKVHISYDYGVIGTSTRSLKYATNESGAWVTTTVDSAGSGRYNSIAVDSNDKVHISYYDRFNYDLKYATNISGSWITYLLDSTGKAVRSTSIAIDSNDKVHIGYVSNLRGFAITLRYATNTSGIWVAATMDYWGFENLYNSMAINSHDQVYISYYDSTNTELKYAMKGSGGWESYKVESGGVYNSLAIDSNDKMHISYFDEDNNDLLYVTNAQGDWITRTVDSGSSKKYNSIALDSNNKVHISYIRVSGSTVYILYQTNASGSWVTETVYSYSGDTAFLYPPSIALDSNNKVHISFTFCDYVHDWLYYATNKSGSWAVTWLPPKNGYPGEDSSIAIDSNDKVHISHNEWQNGRLRYTTNASGSWVAYTVDDSGYARYSSIAVDSFNKIHITYYELNGKELKYATNSGVAPGNGNCTDPDWNCEIVDGGDGYAGGYNSIAVDSQNRIHISYDDYTETIGSDLKYVMKAPDINVTPASIDFGSVSIGSYSDETVTVENDGSSDLIIGTITLPSQPFEIVTDTCSGESLSPSATCIITYRFSPTFTDSFASDSDIPSNDPDENPFIVSLTGKEVGAPFADPDGPYAGTEGQSLCLDGSGSYDPDGTIVLYEWDIDSDGIYDYSSLSPSQCHTYALQGIYVIKLRVTDNTGVSNENMTTANISDSLPMADFTGFPTSGLVPLTVNFTNNSTGHDSPLSYEWDFDNDGIIDSTAENPSYDYTDQGIYTVRFKVIDSDESTDSLIRTNYIYVNVFTTLSVIITGNGSVSSSPGGINCGTVCSKDYYVGEIITLTATPEAGNYFRDWNNCDSPSGNTCTMIMNTDKAVTANFTAWKTEAVDSNGCVGEYTSIATDSSGSTHISYRDCTNGDIKYATNTGVIPGTGNCTNADWNCESLGDTGWNTSIAVDFNNKIHISYVSGSGLKYATNASGSWTISEPIDSVWNAAMSISMVLDSNNIAYISYYHFSGGGPTGYQLRVATNASGSWVNTTIDYVGCGVYGNYSNSLAIDSDNKVHLGYYLEGPGGYGVKYATNASGSWVTELIDADGSGPSIARDSENKIHISYFDMNGVNLKHATNRNITPGNGNCGNSNWHCEVVNNSVGCGSDLFVYNYTSLDTDSSGNVYIGYNDCTNADLKYATNREVAPGTGNCTGTDWNCETIDIEGNVGSYNSIKIGLSDKIHISYYDSTNTNLKYATKCSYLPVSITSTTPVFFYTLQDVYDYAVDGDIIQGQAEVFFEDLYIDHDISVIFEGGYNCDYSAITGKTILDGDMIISDGMLIIQSGTLQVK